MNISHSHSDPVRMNPALGAPASLPASSSTPRHAGKDAGAPRGQSGFTMIEIAIALGVIGFALVAIIGILPSGLEVQRDNRSETIINQDGTFWLETIRNGRPRLDDDRVPVQGLNDLLDSVYKVILLVRDPVSGNIVRSNEYSNNYGFRTGAEIVGLLTTQAADTNVEVRAHVWAISGAAADKEPKPGQRELAFKYELRVRIAPAIHSTYSFNAATFSPSPE